MKKLLIITFSIFLASCDNIRPWFPGYTDTQDISSIGCKRDVTVHFKNNSSKQLIMYVMEFAPGSSLNCNNLIEHGLIAPSEIKSIVVHTGKLGYFVFAEDKAGKCSDGHRKATRQVDCEQANGDDITFDIFQ